MSLELFVFLAGLFVTLLMVATIAFTIYEVRRFNPEAFRPKSQVKPPPDTPVASPPNVLVTRPPRL